ncbi:SH2 domain-containing protein 2A [Dendropsophus ebraccatus]|uniref:SH2 domain-containing protein 2A n=1 Tax=Dendropsophus ebraccatus TaxID=150705 RepID=UPI003831519A
MEYDYHEDFQSIAFSTFKPITLNKDVPCITKSCHEEPSQPKEVAAEAKNKNTDGSSAVSVHKKTSRSTGANLKDQTYQWFEKTQRMKLLKNGRFADWFHGFITRNRAEEILHDKPLGCFLIRFCESRVGFVLSYRGTERCRHFMLNHFEDERYVIEGEKSTHPSLEDLVNHYCRFPMEPYKEMLTTACPMNPYKPVSSLSQHNLQDAVTEAQSYGRINKQNKLPSGASLPLATSPKERNRVFCEGKITAENIFPRKESIQSLPNPEPPFVYAPVKKPSGNLNSDVEASCSATTPVYNPSEEIHTYTEPSLWDGPRAKGSNNVSEPIAFYAVGRGSCNLENVYSEVDINSITSKPKAATKRHPGLSTLPHPASKPVKQKTKATTFHSSFRSHQPASGTQEDARRGQLSRSNMTPHATIKLDDPMYHLQHTGSPDQDEENIYEKIPENCTATVKNSHPGRKAR